MACLDIRNNGTMNYVIHIISIIYIRIHTCMSYIEGTNETGKAQQNWVCLGY